MTEVIGPGKLNITDIFETAFFVELIKC